jgi:ribosomal protein L30E
LGIVVLAMVMIFTMSGCCIKNKETKVVVLNTPCPKRIKGEVKSFIDEQIVQYNIIDYKENTNGDVFDL